MLHQNIALIPAYKPEAALPELVHALSRNHISIVLVDDGSGDEYADIFQQCSDLASILHHPYNKGKGAALKTGLSYIQSAYYHTEYTVVTLDADGQHAVADAFAVLETARQHPEALVIGSRKFTGSVPLRSRFGNTITRFVYRMSAGKKLQDTQTGLRSFTDILLPKLLTIPGDRYEYEMNMLLYLPKDHVEIIEHEIATIYIDDNASSHFDPVKDSARIYKEILKFSASSFISFLIDYALFALFLFISDHLLFSNIAARIISACVNFSINRKFVFKSRDHIAKSGAKYFLLAAVILISNTAIINFLVNSCAFNEMLAKIITEITLFIISWLAQKLAVFKKRKGDGQ